MIVIKNKFIPFKGYETINLFGVLFTRGNVDEIELNHEKIHTEQIFDCFIIGIFIILGICFSFKFSICWILLSPCTFYVLYGLEYLAIRAFHKKQGDAYHDVSFEEEAYNNESNLNYIQTRIPFVWIKYIKIKSN